MKKILVGIGLIMLLVLANTAIAETIDYEDEDIEFHMNDTDNESGYTLDVDILITGKDVDVREDLYGTAHHSDPEDSILSGADGDSESSLREICYQPGLQEYFNEIGNLPPSGFVSYLKALGYDDESHISFIWNLCQQEYINQQQGMWSQDLVGGGVQPGDLVVILRSAIGWLTGNGDGGYPQAKDIALILESYFASDRDVWVLSNQITMLEMRIEALEKTMEEIASDAYCQAKLDMMEEYNLTGVKCGINSTVYWNAKKTGGFDGFDTIIYETCDEDWTCTEWSECEDGKQTRECVDKNECSISYKKPIESRDCIAQPIESAMELITDASTVESYTEQLSLEKYIHVLLMVFVTIATSLVVVGVKKDSQKTKRR